MKKTFQVLKKICQKLMLVVLLIAAFGLGYLFKSEVAKSEAPHAHEVVAEESVK